MIIRVLTALSLSVTGAVAAACGADSDCVVLGDRTYRYAVPEAADGPLGAVVFAHGYRGSARGVMRNGSLRRMARDMGLVLVALKSKGDDWALPNAPGRKSLTGAEEVAYVEAVLADLSDRVTLDPSRMMATGFSAGGMMTWHLACTMPDRFAGFAPVAGTFWKEPPETCNGMASVVHIHGDADRTVPLAGRAIGDTRQGDVFDTLDMYAAYGSFGEPATQSFGDLQCTMRANPGGDVLEFCLFPGGHSFRTEFVKFAWERLEAAGQM